jgi:hypothetical protein
MSYKGTSSTAGELETSISVILAVYNPISPAPHLSKTQAFVIYFSQTQNLNLSFEIFTLLCTFFS